MSSSLLAAQTRVDQDRLDTPRPLSSKLSPDNSLLTTPVFRSTSSLLAPDPTSDNEHFYTAASSSAESFESDTIATPWRRGSRTSDQAHHQDDHHHILSPDSFGAHGIGTINETAAIMSVPVVRPSSIVCTTDGEDDPHHQHAARTVWTPPPRRAKKTFWGATRDYLGMQPPTTPPPPPRQQQQKRFASVSPSPRSRSPDSGYTNSSSPAPRSSSDHSFASGPSHSVSNSPRVVPRRALADKDDSLLGPPLPSFVRRTDSPSTDSISTITGRATPSSSRIFPKLSTKASSSTSTPVSRKSASSTTSPVEPSPVARKRRLNALRGLVPNLNFDQPWSVIDRAEAEDQAGFWACSHDEQSDPTIPQLQRLSLGSQFQVENVCQLANESTLSLPAQSTCSEARSEAWRRSRRFSRSMVSVAQTPRHSHVDDDDERDTVPSHWPERPISPPMAWARPTSPSNIKGILSPSSSFRLPKNGLAAVFDSPRSSLYRTPSNVTTRKASFRNVTREPPRPTRLRKESFKIEYSGYSKSLRPLTPRLTDAAPTWRESLLHDTIYDRVAAGPDGHLEVKRQEVMWEMCETEQVFVRACRDVIRLFSAPLRTPSGQWMYGLPGDVCELFEALEVIAHTHHELSTQQLIDRRSSDVIDVSSFVAQFRAWVGGFACHQQYIVLFNPVTQFVEDSARDDSSTFGEFLRMQTSDKALGSLTLGSMLLKPIQRLTKYPLFLRRLLDSTPSSHPAHGEVVELLEATEAILGGLEACKAREDDFLQLLTLEERLDGLPMGFELAIRGRRLIGHAQVTRVHREDPMSRSSSLRALRATLSSTVKSYNTSAGSVHTGSSGSQTIADSSRPGLSLASSLNILSPNPSRPVSRTASRAASRTASRATSPVQRQQERTIHRSTSIASSLGDNFRTPSKGSLTSLRSKSRKDSAHTMLIFNDMVALATPVSERPGLFKSRKEPVRFRIAAPYDGGIGSVEDVREIKDWADSNERAFALALRAPNGHSVVASYVLAPLGSLPRRAQRTAALAGPGLETLEQVAAALSSAKRPVESDSERGESEHE